MPVGLMRRHTMFATSLQSPWSLSISRRKTAETENADFWKTCRIEVQQRNRFRPEVPQSNGNIAAASFGGRRVPKRFWNRQSELSKLMFFTKVSANDNEFLTPETRSSDDRTVATDVAEFILFPTSFAPASSTTTRIPHLPTSPPEKAASMILHVDMDAFYASVEQRDQPELRGKPVIVGGSADGRGVVCAASYEARNFSIRSAMPTKEAIKRCPEAIILSPRMEHYAAESAKIREIFHRYTPTVEPLSLDEAFLDATGCEALFGSIESIGRLIKKDILNELNLIASVGVAPNKFLAKLASDLEKPDGFTVIPADRIDEILSPLPVTKIWGVGKATKKIFDSINVATIGELKQISEERLRHTFGKSGSQFYRLARGIDDRAVVVDREAKSVSHEHTFEHDVTNMDVLRAWLRELTEQVARRLRKNNRRGKTIQLKVRYSNFETITRSVSLKQPTSETQTLWEAVSQLLAKKLPDRKLDVRLLGMGVSNFQNGSTCPNVQKTLFDDQEDKSPNDAASAKSQRSEKLDSVSDAIRNRFGTKALKSASTVQHQADHKALPRPE